MLRDTNKTLRVAVYGRVSTDHEAQQSAFENQMQWYQEELKRHTNWSLYKVYADKGITGTSVTKRPNFQEMLRDAEDGCFDLIVTREVSRFARNTVDTLQETRRLTKWGVVVYFIADGIWTDDHDGEVRLSLMATMAQDESRKISERSKKGQEISRKNNVYYGNGNVLGYDRHETVIDGKKDVWYEVNPEQARTVRKIFDMYLEGKGLRAIQLELERLGYKTATGKTQWHMSNISRVLQNSFYTGAIEYRKQYIESYLEQRRRNNLGELPREYGKGKHEAIVSKEEFDRVQARFNQHRREVENQDGERRLRAVGKKEPVDVWVKLLSCECGHKYNRKVSHRTPATQYDYRCYGQILTGTVATRQNHGLPTEGICTAPTLQGWQLQMMAKSIFYHYLTDTERIVKAVEEMLQESKSLSKTRIKENQAEAEKVTAQITKLEKRLSGYQDMRADGEISKEEFLQRKAKIEEEIRALKERIDTLLPDDVEPDSGIDCAGKIAILKAALDKVKNNPDEQEDISEEIIDAFVEKIVVHENRLDWYLRFSPDCSKVETPISCTVKGGKRKGTEKASVVYSGPSRHQIPPVIQTTRTPDFVRGSFYMRSNLQTVSTCSVRGKRSTDWTFSKR